MCPRRSASQGKVVVPYEVIRLDRETALGSVAEIRQAVLEAGEGNLDWPRIPVEIDDLGQLRDVLEGWGIKAIPGQLNVQRALDRHAVWVGRGVAVRGAKWR
jgi:hypothetical protein